MSIDIVIPIKTSLIALAIENTIPSILSNINHNQIYIVTRTENFAAVQTAFRDAVTLIDEDHVVDGLTLNSIKDYLISKDADATRAGWYFQQFLKLGIAKSNLINERYLIWDADCIALRPINFISQNNNVLCDTTTEHHQPYFDTMERLLGIKKQVNYSFISEHFVFDKTIVSELLRKISTEKKWWIEILNNIEPKLLSHSGFSEYELYGNFVSKFYPKHFEIRQLNKSRNGTKLFGLNPNPKSLRFCSLVLDYISFEEWQSKYKPFPLRYFKIIKVFISNYFKTINRRSKK